MNNVKIKIILLLVSIFIITQCKPKSNNFNFKLEKFETIMRSEDLYFLIENLELNDFQYNTNYDPEFSLLNKGKKIMITRNCVSEFNKASNTFGKIDAKMSYSKLLEKGIEGKLKSRFSFFNVWSNKEVVVAEKEFNLSKEEVIQKLDSIEERKKEEQKKEVSLQSEYDRLKKTGLSHDALSIISGIKGNYISEAKVLDFEGGAELNQHTISIVEDNGVFHLTIFTEPGVGVLFEGEIMKLTASPTKFLLTIYSKDTGFFDIEIESTESYFLFQLKISDNIEWNNLGKFQKR